MSRPELAPPRCVALRRDTGRVGATSGMAALVIELRVWCARHQDEARRARAAGSRWPRARSQVSYGTTSVSSSPATSTSGTRVTSSSSSLWPIGRHACGVSPLLRVGRGSRSSPGSHRSSAAFQAGNAASRARRPAEVSSRGRSRPSAVSSVASQPCRSRVAALRVRVVRSRPSTSASRPRPVGPVWANAASTENCVERRPHGRK